MRLQFRILALLFMLLASAGGFSSFAYDRAPPVLAHYSSDYARVGFVLDLSSEVAKLKFDGSEEILVLRWQPAAGGDRILVRDDNVIVLRLSGLGGVTLFTPENVRGIPVAPDNARVSPLQPSLPAISTVRDVAGRIMAQLRAETGREIIFEAKWDEAAANPMVRGLLFDAIRNAGTALVNMVRSGAGRSGLMSYLKRVRFVQGAIPAIYLQGDMMIVAISAGQGLAGRPSSFAIGRQLKQFVR